MAGASARVEERLRMMNFEVRAAIGRAAAGSGALHTRAPGRDRDCAIVVALQKRVWRRAATGVKTACFSQC